MSIRRLAFVPLAIVLGGLSMAVSCDDVKDALPDVSAPVSLNISVRSTQSDYQQTDTLDLNDNADFRDNRAQIKFVEVSEVRLQVVPGSYGRRNTLVEQATIEFAHPDSTRYRLMGTLANVRLKDLETPTLLPGTTASWNALADLARTSTKGVKMRYGFRADTSSFSFDGTVTVRFKLRY